MVGKIYKTENNGGQEVEVEILKIESPGAIQPVVLTL